MIKKYFRKSNTPLNHAEHHHSRNPQHHKDQQQIVQPLAKWIFYLLAGTLLLSVVGFISVWSFHSETKFNSEIFISGLLVGIVAQMVDGALGMAYGVTATTFLLSIGFSPAIASGSIHIAEIFTTGASGLSHWQMGNINKKLFRGLIIPGIIGGLTGVFLITNIDGQVIRPWISGYLLIMGLYVFIKAFKTIAFHPTIRNRKIFPLAFFGGFIDSIGGGGWGPVVTSTLLGSGHEPKKTIGSVNSAEFFVTFSTGVSFAILIGVSYWEVIAGLIVGGIVAAPVAAKITSKLPTKFLMIFVGVLIMMLSSINIYKALIN
jgi:uncharacterized membrane protein YfcA